LFKLAERHVLIQASDVFDQIFEFFDFDGLKNIYHEFSGMERRVNPRFYLIFINRPFCGQKITHRADQKTWQQKVIGIGHLTDEYNGGYWGVGHRREKTCHTNDDKGARLGYDRGQQYMKKLPDCPAHGTADDNRRSEDTA